MGLESGMKFNEVDLEEGEWVDYDEKVRHGTTYVASLTHSDRTYRLASLLEYLKLKVSGRGRSP